LKISLPKRSRLLLASGEKEPVPGGDGQYSRFANAFLDELENNDAILNIPALFRRITDRLDQELGKSASEPSFRTIKAARHQLGDFFFVPVST
jgi:hypothetical protein